MTSAIVSVTSDEKIKISFLQGFDEDDYLPLQNLLEKNNYEVITVSALTQDIDADSKTVVLFGPRRDLDNVAIQKLKSYLETDEGKDKNILYFVSPDKESTPKLDNFLQAWQIKVGDGIIFETDIRNLLVLNNPFFAINEYADSTYTTNLKNSTIPVALGYCKPLEILDEDAVDVMLRFSDSAGIRPSNAGNGWTPTKDDIIGNIPSMVVSNKVNDNSSTSHLAVVGTTIGFDNESLGRTSLNNSSYILNVFSVFTKQESPINIEPKSLAGEELGINVYQARVLGIIFMFIIPITMLIIGIVVYIKRKNK